MPDLLKDFDTSGAPRIKLALGVISRVVGGDVFAILPAFNQHHEFGPMASVASVGDKILVAFDEQGTPWAVTGATAPAGAAGGDLTGFYPNPAIAPLAVTGSKIAAGTITGTNIANGTISDAHIASLNKDGLPGTPSLRTLGLGSQQAAAGNDSRLSDARIAIAHASTHAAAGSDPLTLSESQITNLVADLAAKAPLASPVFTGNPTAPTPSAGDNDTSIATTAFVQAAHPKVTRATSPPGSPNDGDIWIYPFSGIYWQFIYDSSETTYKWKFVGGPPFSASDTGDLATPANAWMGVSGMVAIPRSGEYHATFHDQLGWGNINAGTAVSWSVYLGDGTNTYAEPLTSSWSFYTGVSGPFLRTATGSGKVALSSGVTLQLWHSVTGWDVVSYAREITYIPLKII